MIIFESEGNKNLILVILVLLFAGIIFWQWLDSEPFASVDVSNNFLATVGEDTGNSIDNVKNSVDRGLADTKITIDEASKREEQDRLLAEAKKYLENKEANALLAPDNLEDCEFQKGQWDEDKNICNLVSTDSGLACSDSSQCQGYCQAVDMPEIYNKFISEGQAIEIDGVCSENIFKYGCLAIVEDGWVHQISCVN